MSIFTDVKAAVTVRQAAEFYGLKVENNGMTCCPFHPDRHPSMKVEDRYYCFSCHTTGDVIDFVGKLFDLSPYEAAKKIAADFGVDPLPPGSAAALAVKKTASAAFQSQREKEAACASLLIAYEKRLKDRLEQYAPRPEDETWDKRFVAAGHALPAVEGMINNLFSADAGLRKETVDSLTADGTISRIDDWLKAHPGRKEEDSDGKEFARAS